MSSIDIEQEPVTMIAALVSLSGKIAPIAAIAVFMAPIPTIRQISATRSVGSMPLLPYSSMIANGFLWFVYGALLEEQAVIIPNTFGMLLGAIYFAVFRQHCPKLASNLPGSLHNHLQAIAMIIGTTMLIYFFLPTKSAADLIGKAGVTICMIMFASPLVALKAVLDTKSAKSIPLPFTFACLFNCALWSIFGLFQMKDFNIYFPNLVGFACGLAQLALKLIYGDGPVLPK
uniref:Sugar transporter SWEET1 n=1 Tax=Attheya septentrionalis TaxID=420275 RepID=A0A7S2XUA2_9STRA|mmetsp:Transcript_9711/g.17667  ORF Transcript_9711/g.17667 Transcript_9711/m.17667 type:complete len:231 (+) Transcript_9711:93-785(+)